MNLTKKSEDQLFTMWKNCRAALEDPARANLHDTAIERIKSIEDEWDRRITEAENGNYNTTRPTKGMMSRLGYHVGEAQGLTREARRKIIDFVMTVRLPFFHSPMYVKEWGEPNTKERYKKLENFFEGMLNGHYAGDVDRAKDEWTEDLEYLKETYGDI
jgi:hypothetical protein